MLIFEVIDSFETMKVRHAVVGGYALALHGLVRATMDVDFVLALTLKDFENAEKALARIGLSSRLPVRAQDVFKMRQEYIRERNLITWSFVDSSDPSRQVDILITEDLKELEIEKISVGGRQVRVASLEELLRMKTAAGRPQDLVDVENIKARLHGKK